MHTSNVGSCLTLRQLDDLVSGRLDDHDARHHLEQCERCRTRARRIRDDNALLDEMTGVEKLSPAAPAIDGYELQAEVYRGGQAVIYRAVQKSTGRRVAIKVMREGPFAGPRDRSRFEREVEILGQLNHPNIVTVIGSGVASGSFYYVMDYISGQPLDAYLAEGLKPIAVTLRLFLRICKAVHAAHLQGVIHRDLKPSNIRIDEHGEPRVLDFGVAKVISGHVSEVTGQFIGSMPWASPEQAAFSPRMIDVRTDVYQLGVLLFQMLTGRFPYPVDGSIREVLDHIVHTEPLRPRALRREINDELATIVLKCLQKDRDRRYQSVLDLARDLEAFLANEPIEAKRDSRWYVLRKTLHRYRLPVRVAAGVLLTLAAFAVTMAVLYRRAVAAEQRAERNLDLVLQILAPFSEPTRGLTVRGQLEEAEKKASALLAEQPAALATVYDAIGRGYTRLGEYDEAGKLFFWAGRERSKLFGDNSPEFAVSVNNQAFLAKARGEYKAAQNRYEETLELNQKFLGRSHPTIAEVHHNFAQLLHEKGDYQAAEAQYERARALLRAIYGDEHPAVAECLSDIARLQYDRASYASAEESARAAVSTFAKLYGHDLVQAVPALATLAATRTVRGETESGLSHYRAVVEIAREKLGEDHPTTATLYLELAGFLAEQALFDEAESLARRAVDTRRYALGPEHPLVLDAYNTLARVQMLRGDLAGALTNAPDIDLVSTTKGAPPETARVGWPSATGFQSPDSSFPPLATALLVRGEILVRLERCDEAEPMLRLAVDLRRRALPRGHWRISNAESAWGECLTRLGRYEDAERLVVESHPVLQRVRGERHPLTLQAIGRIVELYSAWGREDWAQGYRDRLASLTTTRPARPLQTQAAE